MDHVQVFIAASAGNLDKIKEYTKLSEIINKLFPKEYDRCNEFKNKHLLYVACEKNHPHVVEYLIEKGAKLTKRTRINERCRGVPMFAPHYKHFRTALHIAILKNHNECVQILLKADSSMAKVEGRNIKRSCFCEIRNWKMKYNPIHCAIYALNSQLVQQLLDLGVNIETKETYTDSTPFLSIFNSETVREKILGNEISRKLPDTNSKIINLEDDIFRTNFTQDKRNQQQIISLLCSRGANVHAVDNRGCNAVHLAVEKQDPELLQLALDLGIDAKKRDNKGNSVIHKLAGNKLEIAKILVNAGLNINERDRKGKSILHICAEKRYDVADCVLGLLSLDADINVLDKNNLPPLATVLKMQRKNSLLNLFLSQPKLDLKFRDKKGNTFFHLYSSYNGEYLEDKVASLLNNAGLDINATNKRGETPLHLAVKSGQRNIMEDLLANGANVNIQDKNKNTPAHLLHKDSKKENNYGDLGQLVRAGADLTIPNSKGRVVVLSSGEDY